MAESDPKELAHRILLVEDERQADSIAALLKDCKTTTKDELEIRTGVFDGVPVSIVALGTGESAVDRLVKQVRDILPGAVAILRLGTCKSLDKEDELGSFAVSTSSYLVSTDETGCGYQVQPTQSYPSKELTAVLVKEAKELGYKLVMGVNASSDSFYYSRGPREGEGDLQAHHNVRTVEADTFHLFQLGESKNISTASLKIVTSTASCKDATLSDEKRAKLEETSGLVCLRTLKGYTL